MNFYLRLIIDFKRWLHPHSFDWTNRDGVYNVAVMKSKMSYS